MRYVRTASGFEVDFYARYPAGETELIQVCAGWGDAATRTRDIRALSEAQAEFPEARATLLTLSPSARFGRLLSPDAGGAVAAEDGVVAVHLMGYPMQRRHS